LLLTLFPTTTAQRIAATLIAFGCFVVHAESAPQQTRIALTTYELAAIEMNTEGVVELLDATDQALGPRLDETLFCDLARAGTGVIGNTTYRVVGTGRTASVYCGRFNWRLHRKHPVSAGALGRARFARVQVPDGASKRIDWPHGIGARDYLLVPGRTLAAAPGAWPIGSVVFVPAVVGALIDGTVHDGYLVVTEANETLPRDALALYLGVTGRALRAPRVVGITIDVQPITDSSRVEAVRAKVRYRD
jgi:hypothetical protein